MQGKDPATTTITQEIEADEQEEEERFEDIPDAAMPIELPPCQISKLFEIRELFDSAMNSPIRRERLAIALQQENYIPVCLTTLFIQIAMCKLSIIEVIFLF